MTDEDLDRKNDRDGVSSGRNTGSRSHVHINQLGPPRQSLTCSVTDGTVGLRLWSRIR